MSYYCPHTAFLCLHVCTQRRRLLYKEIASRCHFYCCLLKRVLQAQLLLYILSLHSIQAAYTRYPVATSGFQDHKPCLHCATARSSCLNTAACLSGTSSKAFSIASVVLLPWALKKACSLVSSSAWQSASLSLIATLLLLLLLPPAAAAAAAAAA
jgi:hypothetical protein